MKTLASLINWKKYPVPVTSAFGTVDIQIGEAGSDGPTVLITAGLHGDEGPWGALAIHTMLQDTPADELSGRLRIVPVANPLAMQADLRNAPVDQLDLNRAFPGSATGSYTERVAHVIAENALTDVDYVIDLHGGGSWCVNSFVFEMEGGEVLAQSFDAPFVAKAPDRAVTLTGYARTQGIIGTGIEMGGRSQYEQDWAARITGGLKRALAAVGVIQPEQPLPEIEKPAVPVSATDVLRPSSGGIFIPKISADRVGTIVDKNTLLGVMQHPVTGEVIEEFRAPFDRTAIMLLRPFIAQLEGGAMTYVIAQPQE